MSVKSRNAKPAKVAAPKLEGVDNRMCVTCRTSFPSQTLLRFVRAPDSNVMFDVKGLIDARGAYTCANPSCLEKAVQRKAFARAFDDAVLVDFTALIAEVRASLMRRVLENLGLAYLAGQCVPGRTKADEESEQGRAIAIVVSCDLSERSLREVESRPGISMLTGPQKELLGKALGRLETGVVALLKGRISDRIVCDLKRLESLGFAPN